jgi:hypothetical protein
MTRKTIFVLLTLVLLLAACVPSQEQIDQILSSVEQTAIAQITAVAPTPNVDEIVQATFQALTAQAPAAGATGSISGKLSYPSEGIPPLLVVAFNLQNGQYYSVSTVQNQTTYQIDNLPAGSYHVFAYTMPDGGLIGAYDQFYLCGLQQGCSDFSLVDVQVTAGGLTQNVDPGDWYGDPTQYPPFPIANAPQNGGTDVIPTFTPAGGLSGSIAGQLSYPSEGIPAMAVVAYVAGGSPLDYYYVVTNAGASSYQIDNLPPGNYHVVSYTLGGGGFPSGLAGGYSQAVPCGLSVDCTDHNLIVVQVLGGQVSPGVDPQDWYAPEGTFPAYPLP